VKSVLAAAAVVGALLAAPIAHANGSPTTCDGFLSGGVVEGDLVVPAGATCTAGGVRVLGDVTVEKDARFGGEAVIEGDVTIASGGSFNVTDSAVGGDIVCTGCAAVGLTFMWDPTFEITSTGKVKVRGATDAHIAIEGWRIASLDVRDSAGTFTFIEFHASRDVVFADNVGNAGFWYVSAGGDFEVVGNTGGGDGYPADFTLVGNSAGKDLVFSENIGPSYLETNVAEKDLECFENDPPPTGWGNAAGKDVAGQCAGLTGSGPE
jgi:hypothetical protein